MSVPAYDSVSVLAPSWRFQGKWELMGATTASGRRAGDFMGNAFHATLRQSVDARRAGRSLRVDIDAPRGTHIVVPRITNRSSSDLLIAVKTAGGVEHSCRCLVPKRTERLGVGVYVIRNGPATLIARTEDGKIVRRIPIDTVSAVADYIIAGRSAAKRRKGR